MLWAFSMLFNVALFLISLVITSPVDFPDKPNELQPVLDRCHWASVWVYVCIHLLQIASSSVDNGNTNAWQNTWDKRQQETLDIYLPALLKYSETSVCLICGGSLFPEQLNRPVNRHRDQLFLCLFTGTPGNVPVQLKSLKVCQSLYKPGLLYWSTYLANHSLFLCMSIMQSKSFS